MRRSNLSMTMVAAGLLLALVLSGCGGQVSLSVATLTPVPAAPTSAPPGAAQPVATATLLPTATALPTVAAPATASPLPPPTALPTVAAPAATGVTPPPTAPGASAGEVRQWAVSATASSEWGNPDWAAMQATGAPNTLQCGDIETAWASGPSDQVEWLELRYATPVRPTQVNVVQSYEPDQVTRIELLDTAGTYHEIYSGQSQEVNACPYTLSVPVQAAYQAVAVRVTVDQSGRDNWNEIDAVELVGEAQPGAAPALPTATTASAGALLRQWGASAAAGSEYGSSDYAAQQATGAPDTLACGDLETAWASADANAVDWLEVRYATAVRPVEINIVQTYNPNQVVRVELLDTAGVYHDVYTGQAAREDRCPYTLSISVPAQAGYRAVAVRITVDQSARGDWNEIDAVELVGWPD